MRSLPDGFEAVVIGASGGIGKALAEELQGGERTGVVRALCRSSQPPLELTDELSIQAAMDGLNDPRLILVATGYLHGVAGGPEKRLADLDARRLAHAFAINTIGPALIIKHLAPRLPRTGRVIIGVLTARVGSIADNGTGGWYGYRASKAAANQIVRTAAIELRARRPDVVCVALHPGTVATTLSAPYTTRVAPERVFSPATAAKQLLDVLDRVGPDDTGKFLAWDGREIPF